MKFTLKTAGLIATALIFFNTANAKIWRLNNNGNNPSPAIVADFTGTLQQVHDNASVVSGDTIHVEQSPTTYGNCIFTKRLVVIGAGYYINRNVFTQVNRDYSSTVGDLTFYNANSSGSHVFGLTTGNIFMGSNNLLISRNQIQGYVALGHNTAGINLNELTLRQNFLTSAAQNQGAVRMNSGTGLITNMNITNNIFNPPSNVFYNYATNLDARVSGIFKNNVVNAYYGLIMQNFYILNNISNTYAYGTSTFNNCVLEYNIGTQAVIYETPAGANNVIGAGNQTKTIAQIAYVNGTVSPDTAYNLTVSSEAIGAGKSGVDCGAFGGDYPYKLSGIAPVPNIYKASIAPIASGASTITVTVSAKGNN